jgi:hypothetical protein
MFTALCLGVFLASPIARALAQASPMEATATAPADACDAPVVSYPTRPNWDTGAQTTQCGVTEIDYGGLWQQMGGGVIQTQMPASLRYGVTPRLDLRLGMAVHMTQSGGGTQALEGFGDLWVMVRYRVVEQSAKLPAMAFVYGAKAPTADPEEGFGSGHVDHQLIFVASRDLGRNHFDFNMVGTVVGKDDGYDLTAEYGLALTRPITQKLSWILESYGGPQPGPPDYFGSGFAGVSYTAKPALVLDAAYARDYSAGTPRGQFMLGFTCALPSKVVLPGVRNGVVGHLLGH